ncbi:MAG: hypothetical protein U9P10_14310 [Thermodesulfobacteriota bacterium]|nr:hypothetical protein [Thermodesulfobacteriota bacterium]
MQKSHDYVRDFITIFFIQKNLIITTSLVIIAGAVLFSLFWPPTYAASCSVILKGGISMKNPESIEKVPAEINAMRESDLYSEMKIIQSNIVAQNTCDELVKKGLVFTAGGDGKDKKKARKKGASKIKSSVTASISPRSNIIEISLTWENPKDAQLILDALVGHYFAYRSEIYKPKEAEAFFAEQLRIFTDELEQKEKELLNLTISSDTPDIDQTIVANMADAKNFGRQLIQLKQDYFDQKYRINLLKKDLNNDEISYFTYLENDPISDYSTRLQALVSERNKIARIFHPESSKVKRYDKQIRNTYDSIKNEVKRYYSSERAKLDNIDDKISFLENKLKTIRNRNMKLYKTSASTKMLQRRIDVLADSYTTFTKRLEEAKINNNYKTNTLFTVSLLTRPEAGGSPVFPNKQKTVFMGILAGIVAGLAAGFMVEFFDHTFKRPEDITNSSDMAYLFSIPE